MHKINAIKVKRTHSPLNRCRKKKSFTKSSVFYDKIPRHSRTRKNIIQNIKALSISQTHTNFILNKETLDVISLKSGMKQIYPLTLYSVGSTSWSNKARE